MLSSTGIALQQIFNLLEAEKSNRNNNNNNITTSLTDPLINHRMYYRFAKLCTRTNRIRKDKELGVRKKKGVEQEKPSRLAEKIEDASTSDRPTYTQYIFG